MMWKIIKGYPNYEVNDLGEVRRAVAESNRRRKQARNAITGRFVKECDV